MSYDQIGKLLILAGGAVLLMGVVFLLLGRAGFLGRLPGDFVFSNGNFTCVVPLASMLLISLLLTLVLNIVLRIINH
ncbi:MAG: DUF2905 domain-containing protein [Chloroflexia bacterium]